MVRFPFICFMSWMRGRDFDAVTNSIKTLIVFERKLDFCQNCFHFCWRISFFFSSKVALSSSICCPLRRKNEFRNQRWFYSDKITWKRKTMSAMFPWYHIQNTKKTIFIRRKKSSSLSHFLYFFFFLILKQAIENYRIIIINYLQDSVLLFIYLVKAQTKTKTNENWEPLTRTLTSIQ